MSCRDTDAGHWHWRRSSYSRTLETGFRHGDKWGEERDTDKEDNVDDKDAKKDHDENCLKVSYWAYSSISLNRWWWSLCIAMLRSASLFTATLRLGQAESITSCLDIRVSMSGVCNSWLVCWREVENVFLCWIVEFCVGSWGGWVCGGCELLSE